MNDPQPGMFLGFPPHVVPLSTQYDKNPLVCKGAMPEVILPGCY